MVRTKCLLVCFLSLLASSCVRTSSFEKKVIIDETSRLSNLGFHQIYAQKGPVDDDSQEAVHVYYVRDDHGNCFMIMTGRTYLGSRVFSPALISCPPKEKEEVKECVQ
jgi:hypothetical protein